MSSQRMSTRLMRGISHTPTPTGAKASSGEHTSHLEDSSYETGPVTRKMSHRAPLHQTVAVAAPKNRHAGGKHPSPHACTSTISNRQSSHYRGVSLLRRTGRWHAQINFDGRQVHLGFFLLECDAAAAYDRALIIKWAAANGGASAVLDPKATPQPTTNFEPLNYSHELSSLVSISPEQLMAALGNDTSRRKAMDGLAHGFLWGEEERGKGGGGKKGAEQEWTSRVGFGWEEEEEEDGKSERAHCEGRQAMTAGILGVQSKPQQPDTPVSMWHEGLGLEGSVQMERRKRRKLEEPVRGCVW